MGIAAKMMGGGLSAGAAKAINGDVATGLTAAGTTQGTALALKASVNVFGTVAASSGAVLLSCEVGDTQDVYNGGANALTVYPDSGSNINSLSANSGVTLGTNTGMKFQRVTATRWLAYLSA